jgi:transcriptional regulator with XRE-family HTH domain
MKKDDKTVLKRFGEAVRRTRERRGYSQEEFANLIETERAYYGKVERGIHNISLKNIEKIVTALGVKWGTLFKRLDG